MSDTTRVDDVAEDLYGDLLKLDSEFELQNHEYASLYAPVFPNADLVQLQLLQQKSSSQIPSSQDHSIPHHPAVCTSPPMTSDVPFQSNVSLVKVSARPQTEEIPRPKKEGQSLPTHALSSNIGLIAKKKPSDKYQTNQPSTQEFIEGITYTPLPNNVDAAVGDGKEKKMMRSESFHPPSTSKDTSEDEKIWMSFFEALVAYKQQYGMCVVSSYLSPALSAWVCTQRSNYQCGRLKEQYLDRLVSIGFDFTQAMQQSRNNTYHNDTRYEDFRTIMELMRQQRAMNWQQKVLIMQEDLQENIPHQQQQHQQQQQLATQQTMSNDLRHQEKEQDASKQRGCQKHWISMYQKLKDFWVQHGHTEVGRLTGEKRNKKLINWTRTQRSRFRANKMTEDEKALLNEINFQWNADQRGVHLGFIQDFLNDCHSTNIKDSNNHKQG